MKEKGRPIAFVHLPRAETGIIHIFHEDVIAPSDRRERRVRLEHAVDAKFGSKRSRSMTLRRTVRPRNVREGIDKLTLHDDVGKRDEPLHVDRPAVVATACDGDHDSDK